MSFELSLNPLTDTYIRDQAGDNNYESAAGIYVAYTGSYGVQKGLVRFDFSSLPADNVILEANFVYHVGWVRNAPVLSAYACKRNWHATEACWNYLAVGQPWYQLGCSSHGDYWTSPVGQQSVTTTGWKTMFLDLSRFQYMLDQGWDSFMFWVNTADLMFHTADHVPGYDSHLDISYQYGGAAGRNSIRWFI